MSEQPPPSWNDIVRCERAEDCVCPECLNVARSRVNLSFATNQEFNRLRALEGQIELSCKKRDVIGYLWQRGAVMEVVSTLKQRMATGERPKI